MERQLNTLYNKLAQHINNMIPVEWDKIYLLGSVTEDKAYSSIFYFVESETQKTIRGYDIINKYSIPENIWKYLWQQMMDIVLEINNCFCKNGQESWNEMIFIIDKYGEFNIDFNYNVKDVASFARETVWTYETFGYEFDDDYRKLILKRHFKQMNNKDI